MTPTDIDALRHRATIAVFRDAALHYTGFFVGEVVRDAKIQS